MSFGMPIWLAVSGVIGCTSDKYFYLYSLAIVGT